MDDPRKHSVRADLLGAHDDAPGAVDRAADHLGAWFLLDRQGFAGHHGFIDGAAPFDDHTVHRHAIARANSEAIADPDLLHRYLFVVAVFAECAVPFSAQG